MQSFIWHFSYITYCIICFVIIPLINSASFSAIKKWTLLCSKFFSFAKNPKNMKKVKRHLDRLKQIDSKISQISRRRSISHNASLLTAFQSHNAYSFSRICLKAADFQAIYFAGTHFFLCRHWLYSVTKRDKRKTGTKHFWQSVALKKVHFSLTTKILILSSEIKKGKVIISTIAYHSPHMFLYEIPVFYWKSPLSVD